MEAVAGVLLELPRVRDLLQRCTSTVRPWVLYAIVKPALHVQAQPNKTLKLKRVVVVTPAPTRCVRSTVTSFSVS